MSRKWGDCSSILNWPSQGWCPYMAPATDGCQHFLLSVWLFVPLSFSFSLSFSWSVSIITSHSFYSTGIQHSLLGAFGLVSVGLQFRLYWGFPWDYHFQDGLVPWLWAGVFRFCLHGPCPRLHEDFPITACLHCSHPYSLPTSSCPRPSLLQQCYLTAHWDLIQTGECPSGRTNTSIHTFIPFSYGYIFFSL